MSLRAYLERERTKTARERFDQGAARGRRSGACAYLRPRSAFCVSSISTRIVRPARRPLVKHAGGFGCALRPRGRWIGAQRAGALSGVERTRRGVLGTERWRRTTSRATTGPGYLAAMGVGARAAGGRLAATKGCVSGGEPLQVRTTGNGRGAVRRLSTRAAGLDRAENGIKKRGTLVRGRCNLAPALPPPVIPTSFLSHLCP